MDDDIAPAHHACKRRPLAGAPRRARPGGLRRGRPGRHRMRAAGRAVAR